MAQTVAAFVGTKGEPATEELLMATLDGGKLLLLPRVRSAKVMSMFVVDDLDTLIPGPFGLWEPGPDATVCESDLKVDLDLVLVPGLAFGSSGERLGYGGGYYDRWLEGLPTRPHRMGLCFAEYLDPRLGKVPMEGHDATMDSVATEHAVVRTQPPSSRKAVDRR